MTRPAAPRRPRGLAAIVAAALLVAACGSEDPGEAGPTSVTGAPTPSEAGSADGATVTVTAHNGEVTVPRTDTGIWALDYETALNLLALGVPVDHVGEYGYEPDPFIRFAYSILEDAGAEIVEAANLELAAAAGPTLIIGGATGYEELLPQLEQVAPVVLLPPLPVFGEQTEVLAAVTGREDAAAAVQERLDIATQELRDKIAGSEFDGATVSVLSACGDDLFCTYGNARGFGPILTELGLVRPPSQSLEGNEWGYESISAENLDEQVADVIIAFGGSVTFGAPSPFEHPLFDTSDSKTGEVDFPAWFGVGPLNRLWVLNDLDAILFGNGRIAGEADGLALWAEVTGGAN